MWESVKSASVNEYDIAKVLHKMYSDRFACVDAKRDQWFEFRDHRWHEMDDGIPIKNIIPEDLYRKYLEFNADLGVRRAELSREAKEQNDQKKEAEAELIGKYQENCMKILSKLKKKATMEQIIYHCKRLFHYPHFLKLRDENRKLFACNNGVIDKELLIFRPGVPDDYITFNNGLDFVMMNDDDDDMLYLDEVLQKIHPDPDKYEYFLDFCCSIMFDGNINKLFFIATGKGNTGKSTEFAILEEMLGCGELGYMGKFPRESLIKNKGVSGSSARPELSRVRGKRFMATQELAKTEELNIGFIKEITGNDSFFARTLFEKGAEIKPQFTLGMQCNELPSFPGHDAPTVNRMRILEHEAEFILPNDPKGRVVPDDPEEQKRLKMFAADLTIRDRYTDLARALLCKCFKRLPKYVKDGIKTPACVLTATEIYRKRNDVHQRFYDQVIDKISEEEVSRETFIKHNELVAAFNKWYTEQFSGYGKDKDILSSENIKHELSKKMGIIKNLEHGDAYGLYDNGKRALWYGYRILEDDDDDKADLEDMMKAKK
jgi:phage/plasmid-associated DNA primase